MSNFRLTVKTPPTVDEADTLYVPVDVENTGASGAEPVELYLNGTLQENKSVSLDAGERRDVVFAYETTVGDRELTTATVETDSDTQSVSLDIVPPFNVDINGTQIVEIEVYDENGDVSKVIDIDVPTELYDFAFRFAGPDTDPADNGFGEGTFGDGVSTFYFTFDSDRAEEGFDNGVFIE